MVAGGTVPMGAIVKHGHGGGAAAAGGDGHRDLVETNPPGVRAAVPAELELKLQAIDQLAAVEIIGIRRKAVAVCGSG